MQTDRPLSLAAVLLRRWRTEQVPKLSQTAAAAACGVDQARYSQFERGVRKPGRESAVKIEQATGVPVSSWDAPAETSSESTAQG